jgi:hypothetical protein
MVIVGSVVFLLNESFEQFSLSLLRTIARGGKILYDESQKAFTIKRNKWFVRTIPLSLLVDAWEERT